MTMVITMRCPRCHSENLVKIGHLTYCRDCIAFGQMRPGKARLAWPKPPKNQDIHVQLSYDLSPSQQALSDSIQDSLNKGRDVACQAVTGSGKTEIVLASIVAYLREGKRVGFSLPRRDLAVELFERLEKDIAGTKITLVYGGHHEDLYAPLVVCTTHQLYRYPAYFDLLIIDEMDAFPFANDKTLIHTALASCTGQLLLLSATAFDHDMPKNFDRYTLDRRYHGYDLPEPRLFWMPDGLGLALILWTVKRKVRDQSVMVFVPEKRDVEKLVRVFQLFHIPVLGLHAQMADRQKTLREFREHQAKVLITTTLLERGVTFKNVWVMVYRASHPVFDRACLIQIAGRAGRKPDYPKGEVWFIGRRLSGGMRQCRAHIRQKNASSAVKI